VSDQPRPAGSRLRPARPPSGRPVRRRWLRWLLAIGLACLALVGWGAVNYLLDRRATGQEVAEAVAYLDRTDPGWRLEDIEAARAIYRDEENGARRVGAASRLLPKEWPRKREDGSFTFSLETDEGPLGLQQALTPPQLPDEQSVAELRAELQAVADAVAEARRLADFPNGRTEVQWKELYISTLIPHVQQARTVAGLLSYDVLLRSFDGDADGACLSARGSFNAGRSLGDEPDPIVYLVRIACAQIALIDLERVLAQGQPGSDVLVVWQELLERDEKESPGVLLTALRGERALQHRMMEAIEAGRLRMTDLDKIDGPASRPGAWDSVTELLSVPLWRHSHAVGLRRMTELIEATRLPLPEQTDRLEELMQAPLDKRAILAKILLPAVGKVVLAAHRKDALSACARAAVAAERYRHDRGRWPETLAVLVPDYLGEVPTDPFDGQPLRLVRTDDGLVIYSVGPDGEDNGGVLDRRNPRAPGTDLGFRLWDVDKRRQAPPPRPPAELPPGGGPP
jgi:hypothetical protein